MRRPLMKHCFCDDGLLGTAPVFLVARLRRLGGLVGSSAGKGVTPTPLTLASVAPDSGRSVFQFYVRSNPRAGSG